MPHPIPPTDAVGRQGTYQNPVTQPQVKCHVSQSRDAQIRMSVCREYADGKGVDSDDVLTNGPSNVNGAEGFDYAQERIGPNRPDGVASATSRGARSEQAVCYRAPSGAEGSKRVVSSLAPEPPSPSLASYRAYCDSIADSDPDAIADAQDAGDLDADGEWIPYDRSY